MDSELPAKQAKIVSALWRTLQALPQDERGKAGVVAMLLEPTGFFDAAFYLEKNPDVAEAGIDPALHYVENGWREGRSPCPILADLRVLPQDASAMSFTDFLGNLLAEITVNSVKAAEACRNEMKAAPKGSGERRILRQGTYETLYDMPLVVNWMITTMCNYQCSYCFNREGIDGSKFVPLHNIINAIDNFAALNRPSYDFVLAGGEPTIHPRFLDIVYLLRSKFQKRLNKIQIITNGSAKIEFFQRLYEMSDDVPFEIIISIHPEEVKPEHIYEVARIVSNKINLHLNLMAHPEHLELVEDIFTRLMVLRAECVFDFHMIPLREPPGFAKLDSRYKPEIMDWIEQKQKYFWDITKQSKAERQAPASKGFSWFWDLEEKGKAEHLFGGYASLNFQMGLYNFEKMHCVVGSSLLWIDGSGNMRGAVCDQDKSQLNIYAEGALANSDFIHAIQCAAPVCGCEGNSHIMKFRDKTEAENFVRIAKEKQNRLFQQQGC